MRISIERLRNWIVVAGIVLVVAIVSFFFYARYRMHQVAHDLPGKLGLEIQQSTNGFTVSRSKAGHTQFVLHASKAIQYKSDAKNNGHIILQDVSILMYGKDGSQADQISGSQFDYDQSGGIARANGPVDILMVPPTSPTGKEAASSKGPIHVKTSGLSFNQKTQVASTDQEVTFANGTSSGSAHGATYDGENGTLVLANDVVLHTEMGRDGLRQPVIIKSEGANFNRDLQQLVLLKSYMEYQNDQGTADQATVFFNNGSADHVTAEGHVHVITGNGSDLKASNAFAQLNSQSQLQQLRLNGGLLLISRNSNGQNGDQTLHADSDSGVLNFKNNLIDHLQLAQAVSVVDQQVGIPGDAHGSETREMRASKLDVNFVAGRDGKAQANDVLATGGATITVHTIHATAPQQSTTLQGEQLFATLINGHQLSTLRGDGQTYLLQNSPGGISQTSKADSLMVKFAAPDAASAKTAQNPAKATKSAGMPGSQGGSQIASAVQQGHVVLAELQPSNTAGGLPLKTTATADRMTYDGASARLELSGGTPHIVQEGSDLTANLIDFNRTTGDGSASGGVKATYAAAGNSAAAGNASHSRPGDSIHIVADHVTMDHAKDETTFFGTQQAAVRLWQGPSSITAPTIVLSRTRQLLTAKGPSGSVKAIFADASGSMSTGGNKVHTPASPSAPSVMRITSSSLVYSGGERKAVFSDGVVAQGTTGTLHANQIEVYLTAAPATAGKQPATPVQKQPAASGPNVTVLSGPSGQIDRLVATVRVELQQGDRKCTGEKLVYTADDQHFVLTGSATSPPRVSDPVHGTVTGGSLIFNNRDDSVIVSRGQSATVTDTRTPK